MNLTKDIIKFFLKNPLTIWLRWYFSTINLLWKHRDIKLRIGYLSVLKNVRFGKYNTIYNHVTISNSTLNDYIYIAPKTKIRNATIGKFCSIGPNVKIGLGMHPTHFISTFPAFFSVLKQCQVTFVEKNYYEEIGKITIGNDVWIGSNALVMDNIKIGDGAIIAAGAVVTKDVEPYAIVGGVPARLLKKRFNEDEIKKLLEFKWWNKEENWLKINANFFHSKQDFFSNVNI